MGCFCLLRLEASSCRYTSVGSVYDDFLLVLTLLCNSTLNLGPFYN